MWYLFKDRVTPIIQPEALPDYVAVVNGEAITRKMVQTELKISRLNLIDPLPPLEGEDLRLATKEALNQLITRHLILQAASRAGFTVPDSVIEERVNLLFGSYGDEALTTALQQADATHEDLFWWVAELTTVEAFTVDIIMGQAPPEERQVVYNQWLNEQQATADIKTYLDEDTSNLIALPGNPAPDFTLNNLQGQPVSLADYRGKVVLINFWASWCPSCISEMPDYEAVYQTQRQQGDTFVVLGINLQEDPASVQQYTTGLGLTFPVLLDTQGKITTDVYQIPGMPGSILVDQKGTIFYRHIGPLRGEFLKEKLTELGLN